MSTYPLTKSPITEEDVEASRQMGQLTCYFHNGGQIVISDALRSLVRNQPLHLPNASYSQAEVNSALDLLRSRFWRTRGTKRGSLLIGTQEQIDDLRDKPRSDGLFSTEEFQYFAIEEVVSEAATITFTQKSLNTLENLYDYWKQRGELPSIPHMSLDDKQLPWFHERKGEREDGITYSCDGRTAPLVYQALYDQGFLKARLISGSYKALELTPKAILEVERIRAGKEGALNRGFFIRKWDTDLDAFFKPIMDEVNDETGCEISAVWEKEKNEKLDELILRRIRESSVVVLDVTDERFNVGLEAGYALALRKQIVLIADKKHVKELPFDIRTLNCFFYSREDPEKLTQKLKERVRDALEEARLGTH